MPTHSATSPRVCVGGGGGGWGVRVQVWRDAESLEVTDYLWAATAVLSRMWNMKDEDTVRAPPLALSSLLTLLSSLSSPLALSLTMIGMKASEGCSSFAPSHNASPILLAQCNLCLPRPLSLIHVCGDLNADLKVLTVVFKVDCCLQH